MIKTYKVSGITCSNCKNIIEKAIRKRDGIYTIDVDVKTRTLKLDFDSKDISLGEIEGILEELGYELLGTLEDIDKYQCEDKGKDKNRDKEINKDKKKVILQLSVAIIIFLLVNRIVPDFSNILTAGSSLSVVMLFIVGVTTSFHCVSMCGGIALSQVIGDNNNVKRNISYNLGRVISYTLLGGIVGLIGSGITLNNGFFSVVPIILGLFMVIMGLNNAGLISFAGFGFMEKINVKLSKLRNKLGDDKGPFVLGLVNGLMPCGPLQLMQIYALSTGSFVDGAIAMFAFSLGTVPLMLGLGMFITKLSISSKKLVFRMGGYLVILLGVSMMLNGLSTFGINTSFGKVNNDYAQVVIEDGYQVVNTTVKSRGYGDIVVQKDMPVRLIFNVEPGTLTSCNYAINIPKYNIGGQLQEGKNIVEFYPDEAGTFTYSCWMGMIRNTITVVDGDIESYVPSSIKSNENMPFIPGSGFSCH